MLKPDLAAPLRRRPPILTSIGRGFLRRCPNCGQGRLFRSYLKPVDCCAFCAEPYRHVRSDDAAPWFTILLVGHILGPILLLVERANNWPAWVSMTVWPAFALVLTLAILPVAKGMLISIIWHTRAPGSEQD
jgi:uncharacterized protein (DUF983 family)